MNDQVAIVTGSSSGIGRATAVLMASKGMKVVVTGRNPQTLQETLAECLSQASSPQPSVLSLLGDLKDPKFCDQLVSKTIETFGKIDILINNAGELHVDSSGKQGFEQPVEVLEENVKTNLLAPMNLTQKAYPHLKKSKGSIVFVSSIMSLSPHANMSMPYYVICKAALDHMARSMALEYIKKDPGLVSTPFFTKLGIEAAKVKKMEEYVACNPNWIPIGRPGTPEDIAKAVFF